MQEYFNIDLENSYSLSHPQPIPKSEGGILKAEYQSDPRHPGGPITILTPPLRCTKVKVDVVKNNEPFRKCTLDLQITDNEWRFSQFLGDLGEMNRTILLKRGREWFGYAFSPSSLRHSYINLDIQSKNNESTGISVKLGKTVLNTLDRVTAKNWRNQFLILRLVYQGVLVKDGSFTELWYADQVLKAQPPQMEEEEEEITPVVDVDEDTKPEEEVKEIIIQKKSTQEEPAISTPPEEEEKVIIQIKKNEKPPVEEEKQKKEESQLNLVEEVVVHEHPPQEEEQQRVVEESQPEKEEEEPEIVPVEEKKKKKATTNTKAKNKKKDKKEKTSKRILLSHNRKREW